jgi:OmcA/MtrC family decaheme c-type cytochrome
VAHARPEFGAPGFVVQILGASIDSTTRKTTVNLKIQDSSGKALDRTGVSINFTIAHVPSQVPVAGGAAIAGPYVSYLTRERTQVDNPDYPLEGTPRVVQQPTGESNGTYANPGAVVGTYDYTFAAALPTDYDVNQTHIVALYATRTVGPVRWVSNATYSWVPAGGAATPLKRQAVQTKTCNGCHNPLGAHGGSRQEVQLCLTCHSQGGVDPESNNTIDFNVMVHKIHMGAQLPSVEDGGAYGIVGNGNNTNDYSHVEYPRDITHCQSCHTSTDDERWVTNGSTPVCTSCHENIFQPGVHAFPFNDPSVVVCGNSACHAPTTGNARDAREAHVTFLNTDNAPIFDISILSATVAGADAAPALRVKALTGTRATGATTPVTSVESLSTLNVFFNGPNQEFALNGHNIKQYNKASLVSLVATSTAGEFTFSLPETLRVAAGKAGDVTKDSYTLGIRAVYDPTPGDAGPSTDRVDMIRNPTIAIAAAGTPTARLKVADTTFCNDCHGNLQAHGGDILAKNVEECIMCHTSTLETSPRQSANKDPGPTTSLRFSKMVHRIHAGGMAVQDYVLYGFASAPPYPKVDFSHIGFPGDRRDCSQCHRVEADAGASTTFYVPPKASTAPTQTLFLDADGGIVQQ